MAGNVRQSRFGFPVSLPRSAMTQVRFAPIDGFTDTPDLLTTPGSITSGRNVWIWAGRLMPRHRLQQLGTNNPLGDIPTGSMNYYDISGAVYPVLASQDTVSFLNGTSWQALTYVSGTSNNPLSGGQNDLIFGASTYLPRLDANILVFVNGVDPAFVWAGPSSGTAYSTHSQGLIAADVAAFDDRLLYWNVRYLSAASQLVTRMVWTPKGSPEDTSGAGSGYQDLLAMRGVGTRVINRMDEIILATDQEIWRGRAIGAPFDFQFDPFSRTVGMPNRKAIINTPDGTFWLGADAMVYRIPPFYLSEPEPVGRPIQRLLHEDMADASKSYFGYHQDSRQLTLYYNTAVGAAPTRGVTLNTISGTWTPQQFAQGLSVGFSSTGGSSSSATQWNQLSGTFAAQTLTYTQLLGGTVSGGESVEGAVSSTGTAFVFRHPVDQATDDGTAVTHEATLGALFTSMPERRKYVDTVRLDCRADTASTLSVALSSDLGNTFPSEQTFAVSVQSTTTQRITRWGLSGTYHTTRVRSTGGTWELTGVTARARIEGESF